MRIKKYILSAFIAAVMLSSAYPVSADDSNINYTEILPPGSSVDMSKDSTSAATTESWGVSGNTSQQTVITSNGILLIGTDEKSETITVSETSMDSPSSTTLYYIQVDPSADLQQVPDTGKVIEAGHYYESKDEEENTAKLSTNLSPLKDAVSKADAYLKNDAVKSETKESVKQTRKEAEALLKDSSATQRQLDVSYYKLSAENDAAQLEVDASKPVYERYRDQLVKALCVIAAVIVGIVMMIAMLKKQGIIKQKTKTPKVHKSSARKTRRSKHRKNENTEEADEEDSSVDLLKNDRRGRKNHTRKDVSSEKTANPPLNSHPNQYQEDPVDNDDEATSLLGEDEEGEEETTVLDVHVKCWLVSVADQSKTEVTSNPFVIGKERAKVDFCISNKVVSRQHAKISEMDGSYYLTDLNSSNGTYVNGKRIAPNQTTYLKNGARVTFADQEYIFKVEN